jgi:hypothetical protein
MPHYKCDGCRTRLYSAAGPTDVVGGLCPGCGSPLEPVDDLTKIVGFRSIAGTHAPDELSALREAILSRVR